MIAPQDQIGLEERPRAESDRDVTADLAIAAIRLYQNTFSRVLPAACRFYPSCSEYTKIAIERHGLIQGCWLGTKRICKCHPMHPGGIDYVP
jgi:uncharacterized protein